MLRPASAQRSARARFVALTVAVLVPVVAAVVAAEPWASDASAGSEAVGAADEFLDRYVLADGRVARTDQGGDTVSEGQAYAMLLAAAIGDEARFRLVWDWTAANLRRDDGLLAWRWADGAVVDDTPAADADLIAAGALAIAGRRFDDAELTDAARQMSSAILAHETFAGGDGRMLAAGPWARELRTVNPSYFVVNAMSHLWWIGERGWEPVAATSRAMLEQLTASGPHLPPDWAVVAPEGREVRAAPSPSGDSPRYGYDAVRVLVQLAVDCDQRGQSIAARPWPFLRSEVNDRLAVSYGLTGQPVDTSTHPAALVAAAASAAAAGEEDAAALLLDVADARDAGHPTYYGAAWVALARVWLDTDLLDGCRPGEPRPA